MITNTFVTAENVNCLMRIHLFSTVDEQKFQTNLRIILRIINKQVKQVISDKYSNF
jgi:hypothetical protein